MAISTPASVGTYAPASNASTVILVTTGAVPSGGKIFALVSWYDAAGTLSSVTAGAITFAIDEQGKAVNTSAAIASGDAPSGLSSGATITATFSGAVADRMIGASYSTGVLSGAGAAYGTAGASFDTNALWNGGTVTVANGDILVGGCFWEDAVVPSNTPISGNTVLQDVWGPSGHVLVTEYQFGSGATINTAGTWSVASSGPPSGCRVTSKAYAAGAAGGAGFANTVAPSVTGTLTIGQVLSANPGTWTPTPGSYVYAWERGDDSSGANSTIIAGATGGTYTLGSVDAGKYLRAFVDPEA